MKKKPGHGEFKGYRLSAEIDKKREKKQPHISMSPWQLLKTFVSCPGVQLEHQRVVNQFQIRRHSDEDREWEIENSESEC